MDIPAEHERQAFWRRRRRKRTAVMLAGSATHVLLAIVLVWLALSASGWSARWIRRPRRPGWPRSPTAWWWSYATLSDGALRPCRAGDPAAPAAAAGLRSGDVITAVNGTPTPDLASFQDTLRKVDGGEKPVRLTYTRDGATATATVRPVLAQRPPAGATDSSNCSCQRQTIGVVGDLPADRASGGADQRARQRVGTTTRSMITATFKALGSIRPRCRR